jgi:hypothetical protein
MAKLKQPTVWDAHILDEDVDSYDDITNTIRTSRGEGRAPSRHRGEYCRSNKFTEDGYGELDFA